MSDRLKILEDTFHWRHMVPTAPDTLSKSTAILSPHQIHIIYYDKESIICDLIPLSRLLPIL